MVVAGGYMIVKLHEDDPLTVMEMRARERWVPEHRLVMARAIGRPLKKSETVHHINGDRADNRLQNLQLRQGRHGPGTIGECADCGSRHIIYVGIGDSQEAML